MNHIEKMTKQSRDLLFPIIGETLAKTYFSYYGLFKDGLMFALVKEDKCYLKLASQDIENALLCDGVQRLNDPILTHSHKYFFMPESIMNNLNDYTDWIFNSLEEARKNKQASYYTHKQKIRSLPNMSFGFEKLLKRIHIYSIEQLMEKGEIDVFVELIKIGVEADHTTLFKLYGAINHMLMYTIPLKVKLQLLHEANEKLYASGLRRRFKIKA